MIRGTGTGATLDLAEVVRKLPGLLDTLHASYDELEQHAERVEHELACTNRELERCMHELDVARRHLEAVLDCVPGAVVVRDAGDRVVRVNGAATEVLGLSADELAARDAEALLPDVPPDGEAHETRRADGTRLVLSGRRAEVLLADGTRHGSVEVLEDRTERAALREELRAADELAVLGTMAAGIAHEIRNPLHAVAGFAGLLCRRPELDAEARRWAERIVEGVGEVDLVIESLLSLGSPEALRTEPIASRALLAEAADLVLGDPAVGGRFELALASPDVTFLGDRIKLRQALRNLLANAVDAQPSGGAVRAHVEVRANELSFVVEDAGPGIDPALASRVLDPFFTTRAGGTGLGLALVATIVRLHGGHIELSREPSSLGGAAIGLRLPYRPAPSGAGIVEPHDRC